MKFQTVARPGTPNAEHPEFQRLTRYLKAKAQALGLEFQDYGAVVVIGLGESPDRLGIITHADVQPADASRWSRSPFEADYESEPGKVIGRGTEDDKGPIAIALYAMKTLADQGWPLKRRVELIISYTEESDWSPFIEFVQQNPPPPINIALDSRYPVVSAEKGFGLVQLSLPKQPAPDAARPRLLSFTGGAFVSQIPEESRAVIGGADAETASLLQEMAAGSSAVSYDIQLQNDRVIVTATGKAAHSSEPEVGVNAVTHLAELLQRTQITGGSSGHWVDFINRFVGQTHHAEKFGKVAFSHDFMGPLTLSVTLLREQEESHVLSINLRSPAGKSSQDIEAEIRRVVDGWKTERKLDNLEVGFNIGAAHLVENAPHVPILLRVFSHFTGRPDVSAVSAGGGTHARVLPNGVSFGPHMPGRPYSGHTEREFLSLEELDLDVQMYAAMLVELAVQ